MFIHGFNKTAGITSGVAGAVGKTIGTGMGQVNKAIGHASGAVAKVKQGITSAMAQGAKARVEAAHNVVSGTKKKVGEGLANRMVNKAKAAGQEVSPTAVKNTAREAVMARKARKDASKPSFASKHPYMTAGAAYLAGRYALGGGNQPQQQAQHPEVQQPY